MVKVPHKNTKEEKKGIGIGVLATAVFHLALLFVFVNAGLKYIYPPPEEMGILLDFTQEPEPVKPIEVQAGNEPKALDANPKEEIRLVQKSEAQQVGTKPAEGVATSIGQDGDVEKPEPKKPAIDQRALFTSANNRKKDTLAPQTAEKISQALKAGNPQGNTRTGDTDGRPSANLKGRNVVGSLPFPEYSVNNEGKVVVRILVDQYGKVTNAIPGAAGTTVQDKQLWEAAKKAAYQAVFNISSDAPTVQEGTITYIFKLK
ncbi:MAG: hypothetical protein E7121_03220 [Bacteroidales bacterium]|nr:hypothetical protein [Bacteroidales bacterium]MBR4095477.1 hypothetical protein [Bacteroidales bacterium]